jgi:AraC-like DNA-binding protein
MKAVEQRLPLDFDKSFIVFREVGQYFPCPRHYHPEYELTLITESTGRRMVGDHIDYFERGDLTFIGSLVPHVVINDPVYLEGRADHRADAIVIQFVDNFLGDGFMSIPEMQPFRNFLILSSRGMVIKGEAREKISAIMKKMLDMNGLQRLSALLSIFEVLAGTREYELLASQGYAAKMQDKSSDLFTKVPEYILRNFQRNITLPEIAAVANMAVASFCSFFKKHYRATFVDYLTNIRVGHACKLLIETDQRVAEIAYECGFRNLTNFNRQFKRLKKVTPVEYRKLINVSEKKAKHIA